MPRLRAATLNVHRTADRWQQRRELLIAALVDLDADLIALQELSIVRRQGHWIRSQINLRLSGSTRKPYKLIQRSGRHPVWGWVEGVGVLTRWPVVSADTTPLGQDGRVGLRVNTVLPRGEPLDFVSLQLSPVAGAHETREDQIMEMLGRVNGPGSVAHQLIAGCLQATPDELAVRRMRQFYFYRSAYAEKHGHEPPATFPTALARARFSQGACLDYLFLSPAFGRVEQAGLLATESADVDDALFASDHVGVWADIIV